MRHRTYTLNTTLGRRLSLRREAVDGVDGFAGLIDGKPCVYSSSREGAVQRLLRHFIESTETSPLN